MSGVTESACQSIAVAATVSIVVLIPVVAGQSQALLYALIITLYVASDKVAKS